MSNCHQVALLSLTFALVSCVIEVRAPEEVVSGVFKSAFFCGLGQHTHTHTHTAFREAVIASPALFPDSRDERVGAGWLLGH